MEQKNIDELLDELIAEASGPLIQKLTEEDLKHLDDAYPYEISEEHERKMQEIFKQAGYARSNSNVVKPRSFKKVLIVAAAVIVVFAISCVGAFRYSFVKYYLDIKEECSGVKKSDKSLGCKVDNIYFGYMPNEYELVERKEGNKSKKIFFENNLNGTSIVLDILNEEYGKEVNTENGTIEEMIINEKDMVYSEREDMKILTWKEKGKVFVLYTNDTKNFLLKIAKCISILD